MFIVEIKLPDVIDEEFEMLIPQQRAVINLLIEKKLVSSYSLAADRSKVWVFFDLEKEKQVSNILSQFPIINLVTYQIQELAFYNSASNFIPQFSLN
jgi:muconolactone delta-isomerase